MCRGVVLDAVLVRHRVVVLTCWPVNVSEALRNLVLDHAPNSDTFQKHYLNRNVCVDLWVIHRGDEPQQALIEQATSHGHSRSDRQPANLTAEQSESLNSHPSILALKE